MSGMEQTRPPSQSLAGLLLSGLVVLALGVGLLFLAVRQVSNTARTAGAHGTAGTIKVSKCYYESRFQTGCDGTFRPDGGGAPVANVKSLDDVRSGTRGVLLEAADVPGAPRNPEGRRIFWQGEGPTWGDTARGYAIGATLGALGIASTGLGLFTVIAGPGRQRRLGPEPARR